MIRSYQKNQFLHINDLLCSRMIYTSQMIFPIIIEKNNSICFQNFLPLEGEANQF